jgi:hypothetical protein
MEPSNQAPVAGVRAPSAERVPWRLAAALVAFAVVGVAAWLVVARRPAADAPESLFYALRDRVLEGDGAAPWRESLPRAREDYAKYVRGMATNDDQGAEEWRRLVGLSKKDLLSLPPEEVMRRENLAAREEFFRGALVHEVDRRDGETAILHITTKTGWDRRWLVRRVGGAWKVDNFWPVVTQGNRLIPRDGEKRPEEPR